PKLDLAVEKTRQDQLLQAIREGAVQSAHDIAEGGFAVALAEKVMNGSGLGVDVTVEGEATAELFSETQSRFIVTVSPENKEKFEMLVQDVTLVGRVTEDATLTVKHQENVLVQLSVEELTTAWKGALPCLLKSKA
ncbi:MAG: AIR synthase-related protein, partial [Priestia megaterium]